MDSSAEFWQYLDRLVETHDIRLDRPKGTRHPDWPQVLYEHDYGYLAGTSSADGEEVDVWLGTRGEKRVDAVVCTVDLLKGDCELKLLVGCTEKEIEDIAAFHNRWDMRRGLLLRREE